MSLPTSAHHNSCYCKCFIIISCYGVAKTSRIVTRLPHFRQYPYPTRCVPTGLIAFVIRNVFTARQCGHTSAFRITILLLSHFLNMARSVFNFYLGPPSFDISPRRGDDSRACNSDVRCEHVGHLHTISVVVWAGPCIPNPYGATCDFAFTGKLFSAYLLRELAVMPLRKRATSGRAGRACPSALRNFAPIIGVIDQPLPILSLNNEVKLFTAFDFMSCFGCRPVVFPAAPE